MLLDILQTGKNIQVSYWGPDHKTHIEVFKIPDSESYIWLTSPKTKGDDKSKDVKNWNGQPVYKHKIDINKEKLNKYRLYEIIDGMDDDVKNRIFEYNLPEMFFIDIENRLSEDGKVDPERANEAITIIGIC